VQSSSCQYGNQFSEVYPSPLAWSNTPSLLGVPTGGHVGWGTAQLQDGIVAVGSIVAEVADEGVKNWLQAVCMAPNPTGTAAAWDSLQIHAHIYTIVMSNNFALFSNVSASYLNFVLQSEGSQDEANVAINTGVTVGPPDVEDIESLSQFLDLATSQMQNTLTGAISVAAGQADPQAAFSNFLTRPFVESVYQTDLNLSVNAFANGTSSQPLDIQLSPDVG